MMLSNNEFNFRSRKRYVLDNLDLDVEGVDYRTVEDLMIMIETYSEDYDKDAVVDVLNRKYRDKVITRNIYYFLLDYLHNL